MEETTIYLFAHNFGGFNHHGYLSAYSEEQAKSMIEAFGGTYRGKDLLRVFRDSEDGVGCIRVSKDVLDKFPSVEALFESIKNQLPSDATIENIAPDYINVLSGNKTIIVRSVEWKGQNPHGGIIPLLDIQF